MKVLMINSCSGVGSTGRICTDLADALSEAGHTVKIGYARGTVPPKYEQISRKIGKTCDEYWQGMLCRIFDNEGFGNKKSTEKFIDWIEQYKPDIVHLHNLHGYYINVESLFEYLGKINVPVIWTLHDCWSFTGHCSYFDNVKCNKWKSKCKNCPQKKEYPSSYFLDSSENNFARKKRLFTSLQKMIIVTPSEWLSNLVKQSFLGKYPIEVIKNGVNTEIFCYKETDIMKKYHLEDKKVILGVASPWSKRKGLNDFIKLSRILPDEYKIMLVGLDKKQIKGLPNDICAIKKTNDAYELAELYNAAYAFVNPTYEDNYPTTNIEALACGTPVITYKTGGSPESAETSCVVEKGDYEGICEIIKTSPKVLQDIPISTKQMKENYLRLYNTIFNDKLL